MEPSVYSFLLGFLLVVIFAAIFFRDAPYRVSDDDSRSPEPRVSDRSKRGRN
jgi:hypothetical protein